VLQVVTRLCPVVSHQEVAQSGQLLVNFAQNEMAQVLYGLRITTPTGAITFTSGSGDRDAMWEGSMNLTPHAPWSAREALLPSLPTASARLCLANLQSLDMGNGLTPGGPH
jgi:hypothetical protein